MCSSKSMNIITLPIPFSSERQVVNCVLLVQLSTIERFHVAEIVVLRAESEIDTRTW